jgi:hypothetical protein
MKLRNMFSPGLREHTKALIRFCIDTMYEVAIYDYSSHPSQDVNNLMAGSTLRDPTNS